MPEPTVEVSRRYHQIPNKNNANGIWSLNEVYQARLSEHWGSNRWQGNRGVIGGGNSGSYQNDMEYFNIRNLTNGKYFGDLSNSTYLNPAGSSGLGGRILFVGGYQALANIDYIATACCGNAMDFGDVAVAAGGGDLYSHGVGSNGYRMWMSSGKAAGTDDQAGKLTIDTTANATNYMDMSAGFAATGVSGRYRGFSVGGKDSSNMRAQIDYFTIMSDSNAADFGNLSTARRYGTGTTNGYKIVVACGEDNSVTLQSMEHFNVDTSANADSTVTTSAGNNTGGIRNRTCNMDHDDFSIFTGTTSVHNVSSLDYMNIASHATWTADAQMGQVTGTTARSGGGGASGG